MADPKTNWAQARDGRVQPEGTLIDPPESERLWKQLGTTFFGVPDYSSDIRQLLWNISTRPLPAPHIGEFKVAEVAAVNRLFRPSDQVFMFRQTGTFIVKRGTAASWLSFLEGRGRSKGDWWYEEEWYLVSVEWDRCLAISCANWAGNIYVWSLSRQRNQ